MGVAVRMIKVLVVLSVLGLSSAQLPVPGTIPGLSLEQQFQYILQPQNHLNTQAQLNGRKKRSLPVPGTTGLVPGSVAEAQWYQQQLAHIALVNGRKKRSLPVPGTIPGSAAEAQWFQQRLAQIALVNGRKKRSLPVPGTIPGLVSGSAAEAQWYQQQLAHIALLNGGK